MAWLKKFKFRRRRNVKADYQQHIEELQEELQERNGENEQLQATIRQLQEQLEEKDADRARVQAIHCRHVDEIYKEMEKKDSLKIRAETNLCRTENKLKELYKEVEKKEYLNVEAEANLRVAENELEVKSREINRLLHNVSELERQVVNLEERLQKQVEEKNSEINDLRGRMSKLQRRLYINNYLKPEVVVKTSDDIEQMLEKKDLEMIKKESALLHKIDVLAREVIEKRYWERKHEHELELMERKLEGTERHRIQLETILQCQIRQTEEMDRKLQEQISFHEKQKCEWKDVERVQENHIRLLKQRILLTDKDREKVREPLEGNWSRNKHIIHYVGIGFSVLCLAWLYYVLQYI